MLYHIKSGVAINELPVKLQVSTNTIKTHLRHIYSKLEVKSMQECLNVLDVMIEEAYGLNA